MVEFDSEYWQKRITENPHWGARFLTGKQGVDHPTRKVAHRVLKKFIECEGRPLSVYDLGCGPGIAYESFQGLDIQYTGFDITPKMVEIAQDRYEGADFRVGDALETVMACEDTQSHPDVYHVRALLEHIPPEQAWQILEMVLNGFRTAAIVTFFKPTVDGPEDLVRMAPDGTPVYVSQYSRERILAAANAIGVKALAITPPPVHDVFNPPALEDLPLGQSFDFVSGEVWVFINSSSD